MRILTASFFPDNDFGVNLSDETAIDSYLGKAECHVKDVMSWRLGLHLNNNSYQVDKLI